MSLYNLWGGGGIQPQSASLHSTDNISAEDSEQQEKSRPQQHTRNSKLFVVFPLKSTASHSLHIQHLLCGLRLRFKTLITKEAFVGNAHVNILMNISL